MSKNCTKKSQRPLKFDLESLLLSDASQDSNKENDIPNDSEKVISEVSSKDLKKRKLTNRKTVVDKKLSYASRATENEEEEEEDFMDMTKILENVGSDLNKSMKAKKSRLEQFMKSIGAVYEEKLIHVHSSQGTELEELKKKFSDQVSTELDKWEEEINHIKEQEEKILKLLQQQMKLMQTSSSSQAQRLNTLMKLHKNFIQQYSELKVKHKHEVTDMKEELKQETVTIQKKFLSDVQKEEMFNMRKSISSVFL